MGPALLEAQILDFIRSSVEDSYEPRDLMVAGYEGFACQFNSAR